MTTASADWNARGRQRELQQESPTGSTVHRSWRRPRVPESMHGTRRHQHGVLGAGIDHDNAVPLGPGTVTSCPVQRRWRAVWAWQLGGADQSPNAPENCTCGACARCGHRLVGALPAWRSANDAAPSRRGAEASTTNVSGSMLRRLPRTIRGAMGPTLVSLAFRHAMLAVITCVTLSRYQWVSKIGGVPVYLNMLW